MQDNGPYFMSELGNSAAKPTLVDSEGEVMVIVVEDFTGNACGRDSNSGIFVAFIKKDGTFSFWIS